MHTKAIFSIARFRQEIAVGLFPFGLHIDMSIHPSQITLTGQRNDEVNFKV